MNKVDDAVEMFKQGYLCSQAILATYGPEHGLEKATAMRMATGFGGGIARTGQLCGAVSGAIMLLSLRDGAGALEDNDAKENTYKKVRVFLERFEAEHGTLICNGLLGCNIVDPEELNRARDSDLFQEKCPHFVETAAKLVEQLLQD